MSIQPASMPIPSPAQVGLMSVLTPDAYLLGLLERCLQLPVQALDPEIVSWIQEIRDRAAGWTRQYSLPTTQDEEWRFTSLAALRQVEFQAPTVQPVLAVEVESLPEAASSRLVFVNGMYAPALSAVANLPDGVVVSNLAELPIKYRLLIRDYLAQQSSGVQEVFTALNTAAITDVAVVWVPKHVVVEVPIHLLFVASGDVPTISQPRCLVVAETGSAVTVVEEYTHPTKAGKELYFTNAVTEVWLEENAQVNHTRVEGESDAAFHIGKTAISQARDSRYVCNAVNLGGRLSRHNLEIMQNGEQTETVLNGLTMVTGQQLADTHSVIALNYPYGTSRQLHKCVLDERSHVVFNGKVFVPKPAQLTDAAQLNRNLLLSPKSRVDTKPQLEITADNVKCAHGATVSQLDDEEVFYLRSRGLKESDARNLLIKAFAAEIIHKLPVVSLQARLSQAVSRSSSLSAS